MQHHDAVTGTAKRHVREDYHKSMFEGIQVGQKSIKNSLEMILKKENQGQPLNIYSNNFIIREYGKPSFLLYNSLGWKKNETIKVFSKKDISSILLGDKNVDFDSFKTDENEDFPWAIFFKVDVNPLGYSIYTFNENKNSSKSIIPLVISKSDEIITTQHIDLKFKSNHLIGIKTKSSKNFSPLKQKFGFYIAYTGFGQKSGAYIFRF